MFSICILETASNSSIDHWHLRVRLSGLVMDNHMLVILRFPTATPRGNSTMTYFHWDAMLFLGGLGKDFWISNLLSDGVTFAVQSLYAYRLCILARSWVIMIVAVRFCFNRSSQNFPNVPAQSALAIWISS